MTEIEKYDENRVMKTCKVCLIEKDLSQFYSDPRMKDGLKKSCKDCLRKQSRDYARSPSVRAARKEKYKLESTDPEIREIRSKKSCAAAKKYRLKHNARSAVARALKTGTLIRGVCEICGNTETEAHHNDYTKQLEVRWLCVLHHGIQHRRYP